MYDDENENILEGALGGPKWGRALGGGHAYCLYPMHTLLDGGWGVHPWEECGYKALSLDP